MKEITLKVAYFEAIKKDRGVIAAVKAIASVIQNHVDLPIELTFRGPNSDGDKVASLSFVRAASYTAEPKAFRVNLLTCGFGKNGHLAISPLYDALMNPKVPAIVRPVDAPLDTPIHEDETEVVGLLVGSQSQEAPSLFVRLER